MHRTDGPAALVSLIQFGFGPRHLYVGIDGPQAMRGLLLDGREIRLTFLTPEGLQFAAGHSDGRLVGRYRDHARGGSEAPGRTVDPARAVLAAGTVLEVALPLADLGLNANQPVAFVVGVYRGDEEVERHPDTRPITLKVPDGAFEAHQWRV